MTTGNTSLLKLALPVEGELAGTWGDVVNNSITSLLDTAVAGATVLSLDLDVTLTDTANAANQARQAMLIWTASGTTTRTITAPARSKVYVVINATGGSQSIQLVGAGPTTGVTVVSGEKCLAAWDGSDFVKVASSVADGVTSVAMTVPSGLSVSGSPVTSTGTFAVTTTLSGIVKGTGSGFTVATSGTDYAPATSGSSILKGNGSGGFSSAVSGTDYAPATSGAAILKGNGAGGFSSAVSGTDYAPATSGASILKGNGSGGFSSAVSGTDYAPATSGAAILKGNGLGGFSSAVSGTDYAPATSGAAILKGNGAGGFGSAVSGTDYAPATSGTSILYGNGSGGFSNVTIGSNLTFAAGTLSATAPGTGTVTSVALSGGTTGLTTSGSPITSSGTITLAGTLAIANGGTGATTGSAARTALGLAIGTDVPSPTGSGASGTWAINISGNAATATSATTASSATTATSATTASSATTAGQIATTNFTVLESGGKLVFKYGSTIIASMDSSGNITTLANATAYGTP